MFMSLCGTLVTLEECISVPSIEGLAGFDILEDVSEGEESLAFPMHKRSW